MICYRIIEKYTTIIIEKYTNKQSEEPSQAPRFANNNSKHETHNETQILLILIRIPCS